MLKYAKKALKSFKHKGHDPVETSGQASKKEELLRFSFVYLVYFVFKRFFF